MIGEYVLEKRQEGKGTFGEIDLVTKRGNKKVVYALKKINLLKCSEKDKQHCEDEVTQLKDSNHENVVKFIDAFRHEKCLCIVMEYCKGGNLRQYINNCDGRLDEDSFLTLFKQICSGIKYLHDQNIAHRDIKTTNILLTEENQIKIADFGLAKKLVMENVTDLTKSVGSPYFMSPEMLNGQEYTTKTDIWSLGCCMFEMGTKTTLFTAQDLESLKEQLHCTEKIPQLADRLPYCSELKDLLCTMLQKDGTKRPSAGDLLDCLSTHSHRSESNNRSGVRPKVKSGVRSGVRSGARSGVSQGATADFSKTCPARIYHKQLDDSTSGIESDTSDCQEEPLHKITTTIYVTKEQKECFDVVQNAERLILDKIDGKFKESLMDQIKQKIFETKDMKSDQAFLMTKNLIVVNGFSLGFYIVSTVKVIFRCPAQTDGGRPHPLNCPQGPNQAFG